jgi:Beta-lactamase
MFEPGSYMAAVGGIQSSVDDLLVLYREVLREALQPSVPSANTTARTPLREVRKVLSGHVPLGGKRTGILERTYGLGWIRTQLPGELGAMGLNSWLVERMPVAGQDAHSRLAIYHQGNLPGATSAVYLFPESQSGIVVRKCIWIERCSGLDLLSHNGRALSPQRLCGLHSTHTRSHH